MNLTSRTRDVGLVVGGESRIELLPPEVAARAKARSTRRALVGVVVIAGLVTAGGYGYASVVAASSAASLAAAQEQTSALIAEQAKYAEVGQVEGELAAARAARVVGTATEIDWSAYIAAIQGTLPAGMTIESITTEGGTPTTSYAQASVPLQGPRVATVTFTAASPTVPDVSAWLDALRTVPGFVDAMPSTIVSEENAYSVGVTLHLNSDAYANRFASETAQEGASE